MALEMKMATEIRKAPKVRPHSFVRSCIAIVRCDLRAFAKDDFPTHPLFELLKHNHIKEVNKIIHVPEKGRYKL